MRDAAKMGNFLVSRGAEAYLPYYLSSTRRVATTNLSTSSQTLCDAPDGILHLRHTDQVS